MKYTFVGILMFSVLLVLSGCTKQREVKQYTIEQFMNTTSIGGSSFSMDEKRILFSSDKSGIFNAYSISIDGGEATQITSSDSNSVYIYSYFPNDDKILFRSDQAGNEIHHIYLRKEDGSVKDLTPFEEARAIFYGWSHDFQYFYFGSNKRDKRFTDVYKMDATSFEYELFYKNEEGLDLASISNDDSYIALIKTNTTNDNNMYLFNRMTEELTLLSQHEGNAQFSPETFSNDSKTLYFLSNEGSEFMYLKKYSIENGEFEKVIESKWDIKYTYFSYNERYRVLGINNDAKTEVQILDLQNNSNVKLPQLPSGDISSVNISRSEELMTFYVNGSNSPNNLYVYNFESGQYKKLTESMNPEINSDDLVEAEVIRYKSFDGIEIPAIYYKPLQIKSDEKVPALVWVHGGPGGQSRTGYSALIQYLVNHGYVILAVNNRGSSGYGKTFYSLDDKKHGQDDLMDCIKAKDFLIGTGTVDPGKIGIIGGSYGGYMVLAALAFQPDEFKIGVDIFGVANWLRTLESIPAWWESFRNALYEELGNPETEREMLIAKSPLFHAENIVKPLMVLQGANDPRVLKVESDEIVEAVKKNGVPVEYVVFEDEGHGFSKKKNRITGYEGILKFANKYLKEEKKKN